MQQLETSKAELEVVEDELEARQWADPLISGRCVGPSTINGGLNYGNIIWKRGIFAFLNVSSNRKIIEPDEFFQQPEGRVELWSICLELAAVEVSGILHRAQRGVRSRDFVQGERRANNNAQAD